GVADEVLSVLQWIPCRDQLVATECELVCPPPFNAITGCLDKPYADSLGFQRHEHARTEVDTNESCRRGRKFPQGSGFRPGNLSGKLSTSRDEAEVVQCAA